MSRLSVTVSPDERAELERRATMHGTSMAGFMRRAALGERSASEDDPDAWWDSLSLSRKKQVRAWLNASRGADRMPGMDPLPLQ